MISIDDYHEGNLELAKIIKNYSLEKETIFFIPTLNYEARYQIEFLNKQGFIIGSHTVTHSHLTKISDDNILFEIIESKKIIKEITGKEPEWFCPPRGYSNEKINKMIFDNGYKYIRTTKLFNESDKIVGGCHLTYPRTEYNGIDPFEWAKKSELDHYWGHMYEILKFNIIIKFIEFLDWYKNAKTIHL